jgi:hypothetical protein
MKEVIYVEGKPVAGLMSQTMVRDFECELPEAYERLVSVADDYDELTLTFIMSCDLSQGAIKKRDFGHPKLNLARDFASDRDTCVAESMIRVYLQREGYPVFEQQVDFVTDAGYYQLLPFYLKFGERRIVIQSRRKPTAMLKKFGFEIIRLRQQDIDYPGALGKVLEQLGIPRNESCVRDEIREIFTWETKDYG